MIYYIILSFVILDFVWTQYLAYRNRKQMSPNIPEQLIGIYDQEKYKKQQEYQKENSRMSLLAGVISFSIILLILLFKGFGSLDIYIRTFTENSIGVSLLFIGILYIGSEIISLPFSLYDTFVIEKKYGFNKSTPKLFWTDQIKSLILSVFTGALILFALIWLYSTFNNYAWLYAWGLITGFSLFITFFYSSIIVPLFNKQVPLEAGDLRNAIEKFSIKAGFNLTNIYVMDASKRLTKANAYFTGFGAKKRIVLFDTLINDLTTDEIVAVLAHEIGHYKKKHIIQNLITSVLYTGALLYILSFFISSPELALALGNNTPSFHLGIIAFSILFTPISIILGLFMNVVSRKNEYEADAYAANMGLTENL